MRPSMDDRDQPIFNDIRIDLRSSRWVSNPQAEDYDPPPRRSVPNRIPRYSGRREKEANISWNRSVL